MHFLFAAKRFFNYLLLFLLYLCRLVLASNEVKGRGLCALANSLKFNTSLVAVYVWGNELEESACIVSEFH